MLKSARLGILGFGLGLASGLIGTAFAQDVPDSSIPSSVLSFEEHARALSIAAPQATSRSFNLDPNAARTPDAPNREVVGNVQAVGVGKTDSRLAIVSVYEYNGNVAVNRLIDINSGRVISDERVANGIVPVAPVETEYADTLLRANDEVRALIASLGGEVEFSYRLVTAEDQSSPLFGKRAITAQLSTPDGYVGGAPRIVVNLTEGSVIVGQ